MTQLENHKDDSNPWRAVADWLRLNVAPALTALALAGIAYTAAAFFLPALPLNPFSALMDQYRYREIDDPWACPDQDHGPRIESGAEVLIFAPPGKTAADTSADFSATLHALGFLNVEVPGGNPKLDYPRTIEVRYFHKANHVLACYLTKELARATGMIVRVTPVDIFDPNNMTIEIWLPHPPT